MKRSAITSSRNSPQIPRTERATGLGLLFVGLSFQSPTAPASEVRRQTACALSGDRIPQLLQLAEHEQRGKPGIALNARRELCTAALVDLRLVHLQTIQRALKLFSDLRGLGHGNHSIRAREILWEWDGDLASRGPFGAAEHDGLKTGALH